MKKNQRTIITALALILAFSLGFTAIASARSASAPTGSSGDEIIDRGVAWELLNSQYYAAQDLLSAVGNDFSDRYRAALRNYCDAAQRLIDSPVSTTAQLTQMTDDLEYLIDEQHNPANQERFGYFTVAFTNDGSWSEPIYLYNWSDDGGELQPFPGAAMRGGYVNEYGQKQYYAFVPMDVPNIVISTNQLRSDDPDHGVPCVRVQTVDIFVSGNTGYYLTGARDGKGSCKVATWELKAPSYKTFHVPDPTEQVTEQPTAAPTVAPTVNPTEAPTEKPTVSEQEYESGAVLVSMNSGTPDGLLDGFEIEECRLITPGSTSMAVYHVRFKEKTKEIVWRAIEVLRQSPRVKIAEPNYYYSFEVIDDPDPIRNHLVGDADADGEISVLDATCIQRVLAGYDTEKKAAAERYACITGKELNILDATAIQRYLAGYTGYETIGTYFPAAGLKQ